MRSYEISKRLYYSQSVQIRLAHPLYKDRYSVFLGTRGPLRIPLIPSRRRRRPQTFFSGITQPLPILIQTLSSFFSLFRLTQPLPVPLSHTTSPTVH